MPNASDIQYTKLSSHNHIDALLDHGPDWNYRTSGGNTIYYTFSVSSGLEDGETGQVAFTAAQMAATRGAMQYVSGITGVNFVETSVGTTAQVHFCMQNIADPTTSGLCSWYTSSSVVQSTGELVSYSAEAFIYLDNTEFGSENANLAPGGEGYETLLHEIGHMLGLKHPFESQSEYNNTNVLNGAVDNSLYTIMSYNQSGGPYTAYRPYDIAALNWIYGRDGIGGALGMNSTSGARYLTGSSAAETLTGTSANDVLRGDGGNDTLNGGAGNDTAVFSGASTDYAYYKLETGGTRVTGADGVDVLNSIEIFQFSDGNFSRAQLGDNTAPGAPTLSVTKNSAGYVVGNTPFIAGIAEAGATVKLYSGNFLIGTATANSQGVWSTQTSALGNGSYSVTATATDTSGNISVASAPLAFNVDATPPTVPTGSVVTSANGNQHVLSGTGEAGTVINLVNMVNNIENSVIGQVIVPASGNWSLTPNPLANGSYNISVQSVDIADNVSQSASRVNFTVSSSLNIMGTSGNDNLTGTAANNAITGGAGVDTMVYSGNMAAFTLARSTNGFTARSNADGLDSLYGVERIKFADAYVAIDMDGTGGKAYRLYRAAFDRVPDEGGVGFWITMMDRGVSATSVADGFIKSNEFVALYGANSSNFTFVSKLYQHVLHRGPDGDGFQFWMDRLAAGVSRADVLTHFSESAENIAQVVGSIVDGFEYIPYNG